MKNPTAILPTLTGFGVATLGLVMAVAVWMLPAPILQDIRRAPQNVQQVPEVPALDLAAVTAKPLFDRSRRPMKAAPAPVQAAPKPVVITLTLQGVIGNSDGGLTALVRASNTEELFARRLGERLGAFTVEKIGNKEVVLRSATGQTKTLVLGTE